MRTYRIRSSFLLCGLAISLAMPGWGADPDDYQLIDTDNYSIKADNPAGFGRWDLVVSPGGSFPSRTTVRTDVRDPFTQFVNQLLGTTETVQGTLHNSWFISASLRYQANPWIAVGMESGYALGHIVDVDNSGNPLNYGFATDEYQVRVLELGPLMEIGPWVRKARYPWKLYGLLGVADYQVQQTASLIISGENAVSNSRSDNYLGVSPGAGFAVHIRPDAVVGIEVRYHRIFTSGYDLALTVPTLRCDYNF